MNAGTLPVLESGDHLSRVEFHRRYCERPDIKKAELVLGVLYVGGRVPIAHGEAHAGSKGYSPSSSAPVPRATCRAAFRLQPPSWPLSLPSLHWL